MSSSTSITPPQRNRSRTMRGQEPQQQTKNTSSNSNSNNKPSASPTLDGNNNNNNTKIGSSSKNSSPFGSARGSMLLHPSNLSSPTTTSSKSPTNNNQQRSNRGSVRFSGLLDKNPHATNPRSDSLDSSFIGGGRSRTGSGSKKLTKKGSSSNLRGGVAGHSPSGLSNDSSSSNTNKHQRRNSSTDGSKQHSRRGASSSGGGSSSGGTGSGAAGSRRSRGSTIARKKTKHEKYHHDLLTFPQEHWRTKVRGFFYPGLRSEELAVKALRGEAAIAEEEKEKEKEKEKTKEEKEKVEKQSEEVKPKPEDSKKDEEKIDATTPTITTSTNNNNQTQESPGNAILLTKSENSDNDIMPIEIITTPPQNPAPSPPVQPNTLNVSDEEGQMTRLNSDHQPSSSSQQTRDRKLTPIFIDINQQNDNTPSSEEVPTLPSSDGPSSNVLGGGSNNPSPPQSILKKQSSFNKNNNTTTNSSSKRTSAASSNNNNSTKSAKDKLIRIEGEKFETIRAEDLTPPHPIIAHWFENLMYGVILLNLIILASSDPYELRADAKKSRSGISSQQTFNLIVAPLLLFEVIVFGIAQGFHKLLKIRQTIQTLLIVGIFAALIVDVSGAYPNRYFGGSVLLVLRLIKPLQHFAVFERLTTLTDAIVGTISKLFDVTFLYLLFLVVASVACQSFLSGSLRHRCVNEDFWNKTEVANWNFSHEATATQNLIIDFVCGGLYDQAISEHYWSLNSSTMQLNQTSLYCDKRDAFDKVTETIRRQIPINATSNSSSSSIEYEYETVTECLAPPPPFATAPLYRQDGSHAGCSPDQICDPGRQQLFGVTLGYKCPFRYRCERVINLRDGWAGFDNFGMAVQTMFVSATWQLWFDLAMGAANATNLSLIFFFIAFVWFADMLTGLIVVKVSLAFEVSSQKARRAWNDLREKKREDERKRKQLTGVEDVSLFSSVKSLAAALVMQKKKEEALKEKENMTLDTYLNRGGMEDQLAKDLAAKKVARARSATQASAFLQQQQQQGRKSPAASANDGIPPKASPSDVVALRAKSSPAAGETKRRPALSVSKFKKVAMNLGQAAMLEKMKRQREEELKNKPFFERAGICISAALSEIEFKLRPSRLALARNILCTRPYFFFIAFVNAINVCVIALFQKKMNSFLENTYYYGDLACLVILTFDCLLRLYVMAPTTFFTVSKKNALDFVVTGASWIDVVFDIQNMKSIRILRAFRPIELLAYSPNLFKWVKFAMVAIESSPVVLFVLFCIIVVFALAGMQLFGGGFCGLGGDDELFRPDDADGRCGDEGPRPRAHFDDFGHALITSFQIVTGDNWDDVMFNAMTTRGWWMGAYFSVYFFFASFMMVALLNGIIFSSFAQQSLKEDVARKARQRANAISPTSSAGRRGSVPPGGVGSGSTPGNSQRRGSTPSQNNNNNNMNSIAASVQPINIEKELEKIENENEAEGTANGSDPSSSSGAQQHQQQSSPSGDPSSPTTLAQYVSFGLVGASDFVKGHLAGKGVQLSMFRKQKSYFDGEEEDQLSGEDDDDDDDDSGSDDNNDNKKSPSSPTSPRSASSSSSSPTGKKSGAEKKRTSSPTSKKKKKNKKSKKNKKDGDDKAASSPGKTLGIFNPDDLDALFGTDRKRTWGEFRVEVLQPIARHKYTENFILLVILVSIVANILTLPTSAPDSSAAQLAINVELVTRALFTIEAIFMISAYGFDPRNPDSYLRRTNWNIFEFAITIANIVSIFLTFFVESTHWSVLFFSTFIAIRPLRIVRRSPSMSLVLRALANALIAMRYAIVAIFLLILLYAIAGTQVFAGKFDRCLQNITLDEKECEAMGYEFNNPLPSFDNSFESLFSVFIILTLELWTNLMYTAMDITELGKAPYPNANPIACFYFIFFAVIGGWFCVSIFMSVLVDSYNRCKRTEAAQRSILTDREQNGWLKSTTYLLRALPNHALLHEHRHPSLFSNMKMNQIVQDNDDDDDDQNNNNGFNDEFDTMDGDDKDMTDFILSQSDDLGDDELALLIAKRKQEQEAKRKPLILTGNIDEDLEELLMDVGSPSSSSNVNINNNDKNASAPNSSPSSKNKNNKHKGDTVNNGNFLEFILIKIRGWYGDFTAALDRSPTYRHVQKQFSDIVSSPLFILVCNFISVANFVLLCLQIFPTPELYGQILETLQDVLAVLFGVEAFCKILGESFAVYIASKWNKFDFFVAVTSIAGLIFRNFIDSRVRSAVWSLRLIRIVKIFRGRKTLATLVSHFGVALMSLSGVFSIITIFYFAFAVFSAQLFGRVVWQEDVDGGHTSISRNANFATVPMAMYTLLRISFMGDWPNLFWGLQNDSPGCDAHLGNCGPSTPIPQIFFVVSIIFFTYVCRNLVLAVLIDSFSSAGDIRAIQKWQAKAIVKAWKMYDPEFTGVMRGFDVIHVLRRIPIWCTLGFRHFSHAKRIQLEMAFLTLLNIDDPNANNFAFIQKRREEAQARIQSVAGLMMSATEQQQNQQIDENGQLIMNNNTTSASPNSSPKKKGGKGKNKKGNATTPASPNAASSSSPTNKTSLLSPTSLRSPTSPRAAASTSQFPTASPLKSKNNNSNNNTNSSGNMTNTASSSSAPPMSPTSMKDRRRLSHGGVTFENFVDVLCHMAFNCPAPTKRSLKMHRMYEKDHVGESGDPLEEPDDVAYENAVRIIFNAAMKRLIVRRRKRLRAASFAKKKARMEAAFPQRLRKNNDDDSDFDEILGGEADSSSRAGKKKIVSHSSNAAEELAEKIMAGGTTIGETFGWLMNKVKGIAKSMTTDYTRPTEKDEFGVALSDDDDDEEEQRKIAMDAAFDEEAVKEDIAQKIETAQYEGWDYCEDGIYTTRRAKTTKNAVTHAWFSMQGQEGMKLLQGTPPPDDPLEDEEMLPISKQDFAAFSLI